MIKKKSLFVFVLTMCAVMLATACSTRQEKRDHFVKKAKELEESHDLLKARVEYKNAIQVDPKCIECYLALARLDLRLGDFRGAFQAYNAALGLNPDRSDVKLALARLYLISRAAKRAEKLTLEVLKREPQNVDAKLLYALSLAAQPEKIEEAKKRLVQFIEGHPDMQEPYIALSGLFEREHDFEKAIELLREAEGKTTKSQGIKQALIRIYAARGDINSALAVANELKSKQPGNPGVELLLAKLYERKGDIESSRHHWEKALELGRKHGKTKQILLGYGQFLGRHGFAGEAQRLLERQLEETPEDINIRIALSRVYVWQKKWDQALKILNEVNVDDLKKGEKISLLDEFARLHLAMGSLEKAKHFADRVLKDNPKDATSLLIKAKIALIEKNGKEAVLFLRRLLDDDPQNVRYRMMLAQAHLLNKEYKLAEDQYRKLVRVEPKNINTWVALVDFYLRNGEIDLASDAIDEALQNVPNSPVLHDLKGWVCVASKDAKCAVESFEKAIGFAPKWLVPYRDLARVYASAGDLGSAEAALKKAIENFPKNAAPEILLASFYEQTGRLDHAIEIYRRLVKRVPDNPLLYNNLAYLLSQSTQDHQVMLEARMYADKAYKLMPDQPNIMDTRAWILYKLGHKEEALKLLNQALEKNNEDPTILYHKAIILSEKSEIEEAKKILKHILSRKQWYPERKEAEALLKNL